MEIIWDLESGSNVIHKPIDPCRPRAIQLRIGNCLTGARTRDHCRCSPMPEPCGSQPEPGHQVCRTLLFLAVVANALLHLPESSASRLPCSPRSTTPSESFHTKNHTKNRDSPSDCRNSDEEGWCGIPGLLARYRFRLHTYRSSLRRRRKHSGCTNSCLGRPASGPHSTAPTW